MAGVTGEGGGAAGVIDTGSDHDGGTRTTGTAGQSGSGGGIAGVGTPGAVGAGGGGTGGSGIAGKGAGGGGSAGIVGAGGSGGTGGIAGSGGHGSVGGTGGSSEVTAACQEAVAVDRGCTLDSECVAVMHTTNCCGSAAWIGINTSAAQHFSSLEKTCDAGYPPCGCAAVPPVADEGSAIPLDQPAGVTCTAGTCKTFSQCAAMPVTRTGRV